MSIKQLGAVVAVWLVSLVAACAVPVDDVSTGATSAAVANPDDPGGDPGGGGGATRACGADIDCNFACICSGGFCQPDGFGPPAPGGHCNLLPTRLCWADSVCAAGCICGSNSHCEPDGFSPANPDCHLPP